MAERKSLAESMESFVERQIQEAQRKGAFDNLPGAGKPIEGLEEPIDDMWWWRRYFEREGLSLLPEALALVRDAERLETRLDGLAGESEVRAEIEELNRRIRDLVRYGSDGPAVEVRPRDVTAEVAAWRRRRRRV